MKILAALALSLTALARQDPLPNDPTRPVKQIAHDLNIEPEQFVVCFANVHPAPRGEKPTADNVRANKKVLLSCLQKANTEVTSDKLDAVMDKYRPGGREAQRPDK